MPNYTVKADKPDSRDYIANPSVKSVPSSVSLLPFLGPVKDQGQEGSCTSFAFTGMREFLYRKYQSAEQLKGHNIYDVRFSPAFFYYQERVIEGDVSTDGGAQSRTGIEVLREIGVCIDKDDPYTPADFSAVPSSVSVEDASHYKTGTSYRVPNLDTLKTVLASGYVVCLGFNVYDSFESQDVANTGKVPIPTNDETCLGGHEVLMFGYDDDFVNVDGSKGAVFCRNSWSSSWGLLDSNGNPTGNFALPYGFWSDSRGLIMDMWYAHPLGS